MTAGEVAQFVLAAGGVSGCVAGLVALYHSRAARRRLDAETDKLDADAERVLTERASAVNAMALDLLEPMQGRIHALTGEMTRLQLQVDTLTQRIHLLQRLLNEHRIPYPPMSDSLFDGTR